MKLPGIGHDMEFFWSLPAEVDPAGNNWVTLAATSPALTGTSAG